MIESKDEYVYVLEAVGGGWFKIGRSKNPFGRIADLQTGCPYPIRVRMCFLAADACRVEDELHKLGSLYRGSGEWFSADADVVRRLLEAPFAVAKAMKELDEIPF